MGLARGFGLVGGLLELSQTFYSGVATTTSHVGRSVTAAAPRALPELGEAGGAEAETTAEAEGLAEGAGAAPRHPAQATGIARVAETTTLPAARSASSAEPPAPPTRAVVAVAAVVAGATGGRGRIGGGGAPGVKQCDENCPPECDNARIYISGLPKDVTVDELVNLFGGIGMIARIKQKRGYKDQWPYNVKLYTDERGQNKGDGVLTYEDPQAAHSAGGFFNGHTVRGSTIKVSMAEKSAPRPGGGGGRGGGGFRGGRGGFRGGGGPDRRDFDRGRPRPY
ncbi:hypothetical protein CLOP_g11737 [Closterium sp. NIES-67]|nr:hypothetical protein CLOP_g11737 [Closterium sp. NIES-67]